MTENQELPKLPPGWSWRWCGCYIAENGKVSIASYKDNVSVAVRVPDLELDTDSWGHADAFDVSVINSVLRANGYNFTS